MSQIEELFYAWTDDASEPEELRQAHLEATNAVYGLEDLIGVDKANKIDSLYMECVCMEQIESFKAGFICATELWKECRI